MTKEPLTSWIRVGIATLLIATWIITFVGKAASTDQLVLEAILAVCAVGMLAQGISGLVRAGRR